MLKTNTQGAQVLELLRAEPMMRLKDFAAHGIGPETLARRSCVPHAAFTSWPTGRPMPAGRWPKLPRSCPRGSDFYDLWLIAETFQLDRAVLAKAVRQTFARRETALQQGQPVGFSGAYADAWADQWRAFLTRDRMAAAPQQLATVTADLERFLMPLTEDVQGNWRWKPGHCWRPER